MEDDRSIVDKPVSSINSIVEDGSEDSIDQKNDPKKPETADDDLNKLTDQVESDENSRLDQQEDPDSGESDKLTTDSEKFTNPQELENTQSNTDNSGDSTGVLEDIESEFEDM